MNQSTLELSKRSAWALGRVGELVQLGRDAGWLSGPPTDGEAIVAGPTPESNEETPMSVMVQRLGLTEQEADALWLLVTLELDPHVWQAARLLLSSTNGELNVQILEHLVGRGSIVEEDIVARLEKAMLVETVSDPHVSLHRRPIRAHDRVIALARGRFELDLEIRSVASLEAAVDLRRKTREFQVNAPIEIHPLLARNPAALVTLTGRAQSGRTTTAHHVISGYGHSAISIRCRSLPTERTELVRKLRGIARECRLHDAWPIFIDCEHLEDRIDLVEREVLRLLDVPVFATAPIGWTWNGCSRQSLVRRIDMPCRSAREELWRKALPQAAEAVVEACAARYAVSPGMIASVGGVVSSVHGKAVSGPDVHVALRDELEQRLSCLATRVETRQTWDDLVLPVDQFDVLIEMVARIRHRDQVLDDWGFANKVGRGLGLTALLSGPPGTGKTMVAGLLARELGLDLYQVDMSKVVSKYIGETEKQLATLFDAAESGHALLLFDEADSLFAKRTEVKSSNDRYANLEVNYLLQRLEAFSGITLLTTNHETAIDTAFLRRLSFHVRVPMPDEQQRELLWRTMIPDMAEREDNLDFGSLAHAFNMSGGYIKNAVLRAAFLAADEATPIGQNHLLRAAHAEYEAIGKLAVGAR